MKQIQLGGRKGAKIKGYALVDDADFGWLNNYHWYLGSNGYAATTRGGRKKKRKVYMHEVLIYRFSGTQIDHKDQNKLNNAKANLRLATKAQNMANCVPRRDNVSGFKGVYWLTAKQKWVARIQKTQVGSFNDKVSAARAYNEAAKKVFGEFACLNKV